MKKLAGLLILAGLIALPQMAQAKFAGDDWDGHDNGLHKGWTQGNGNAYGRTNRTVNPEPVSTVLFLTGGAALVAAKLRKK